MFFGLTACAQEKQLELTNTDTGKVKVFRENKKIKIFTDDLELKGKLKIIDDQTISIRGIELHLSDIRKIRNKATLVKLYSILGIPYGTIGIMGSFAVTDTNGAEKSLLFTGIGLLASSLAATQLRSNFVSDQYAIRIIERK